MSDPAAVVPFREAVRAWFVISLQTFGGPAGQIAVMQRHLVDERRWIGQQRFLHALNYCMLLPGPEAQQLAIYIGWLLNGLRGGLVAGTLFVLPGLVSLLALSMIYAGYGDTALVGAVFAGVGPAVVAIVAQAVWRVGRRALTGVRLVGLAVAAFVALAVFAVPFPLVIAVAAVIGLLGRDRPRASSSSEGPPPLISDDSLHDVPPSARRTLVILVVGLSLWILPVVAAGTALGWDGTLARQGVFFGGTAAVTFGGAYAMLSFVAQRAVEHYGWLSAGDMVRGLALAETTPGPLIMVVQFVAFLGAFHHPGPLDPWVAGVLASLLTTWVTFVPSFVFILLGAPYVERLRGNRAVSRALTGITAAVVGVIAQLGLYFATHTLFAVVHVTTAGPVRLSVPELGSVRPVSVGIAVVAAVLIFWRSWSVPRVLGVAAALGLAAAVVGLA